MSFLADLDIYLKNKLNSYLSFFLCKYKDTNDITNYLMFTLNIPALFFPFNRAPYSSGFSYCHLFSF